MAETILGLSAYYHDSAAAITEDGKIIAAAHEERFTRIKHDSSFPHHAVKYVISEWGKDPATITTIAFYDKPYLKLERLLETYHAFAPKGLISFLSAIPVWIKEKLFMKKMLRDELAKLGFRKDARILFPEHHLSHAASAFYPSPFEEAAILTIDGVGEWATTTIGYGKRNQIKILKELHFPHSLGLLYSAFTYYTGFRVNSGEYKLMGLAPYGIQGSENVKKYKQIILEKLVDIRDDGSLLLNMQYFNYATGLRMTRDKKWTKLFGIPPRQGEAELTQPYMDMALAIQQVTEEVVIKLARTAKLLTNARYLVMAGGVALNSVANGKLHEEKLFDDIWIQPAAGDAGGAVGAALAAWYIWGKNSREADIKKDQMMGSFLGPQYSNQEIEKTIRRYGAVAEYFGNFDDVAINTAKYISESKVVGWFQGRMEFGPRALGNRSILGDARDPEMQKRMNLKIKYREGFRPFAPSVLEEDINEYFQIDKPSPYMLFVVPVLKKLRKTLPENYLQSPMYERLYFMRSEVPAITHLDFSARLQSVNKETNPRYWQLIHEFKKITGCGVIINTSFNVRGEPIVCTPGDALRCFINTEMDFLVMGNFILDKNKQAIKPDDFLKQRNFQLD